MSKEMAKNWTKPSKTWGADYQLTNSVSEELHKPLDQAGVLNSRLTPASRWDLPTPLWSWLTAELHGKAYLKKLTATRLAGSEIPAGAASRGLVDQSLVNWSLMKWQTEKRNKMEILSKNKLTPDLRQIRFVFAYLYVYVISYHLVRYKNESIRLLLRFDGVAFSNW